MLFQKMVMPVLVMANPFLQAQQNLDFLHFRISMPTGYTLVNKSPRMMDFNLYEIRNDSKLAIAQLYVGNHPQFTFSRSRHTKASVSPSISISQTKDGLAPFEFMLEFAAVKYKGSPGGPWTRIHVFGISNVPGNASMVLSAFKGIQIVRPNIE